MLPIQLHACDLDLFLKQGLSDHFFGELIDELFCLLVDKNFSSIFWNLNQMASNLIVSLASLDVNKNVEA